MVRKGKLQISKQNDYHHKHSKQYVSKYYNSKEIRAISCKSWLKQL